ncbi:hypothetical protein IEO21_08204 [Rhodonia placenta]|uniref:Uncharacterized protein n=1 Tax=Rhodonia placenta TaxID=104341 RepID=A0A8H7NWM8_9APHY|nr:hypothetical protein IEO21_08204 [Postia placenta]
MRRMSRKWGTALSVISTLCGRPIPNLKNPASVLSRGGPLPVWMPPGVLPMRGATWMWPASGIVTSAAVRVLLLLLPWVPWPSHGSLLTLSDSVVRCFASAPAMRSGCTLKTLCGSLTPSSFRTLLPGLSHDVLTLLFSFLGWMAPLLRLSGICVTHFRSSSRRRILVLLICPLLMVFPKGRRSHFL